MTWVYDKPVELSTFSRLYSPVFYDTLYRPPSPPSAPASEPQPGVLVVFPCVNNPF